MKITLLSVRNLIGVVLFCVVSIVCLISYRANRLSFSNTNKSAETALKSAAHLAVNESLGKLPLSFEANQGQTDEQVKFLARGNGYNLFLTPTEAVLKLNQPQENSDSAANSATKTDVIRLKLQGANPKAKIAGVDELTGKSNYLIGHDAQKWRHDVTRFAKVKYEAVYPGIDLIYYGQQRQLEYDWIVAPQADIDKIRLAVAGVSQMQVDSNGDLILQTAGGEVRQHRPVIYQEAEGEKKFIEGRYVMKGSREVGFELAAYDTTRAVVIDPVLSYSTYFGGNGTAFLDPGIALDKTGNIYLAGRTSSVDFPTQNAFQPGYGGLGDVMVTKLLEECAQLSSLTARIRK